MPGRATRTGCAAPRGRQPYKAATTKTVCLAGPSGVAATTHCVGDALPTEDVGCVPSEPPTQCVPPSQEPGDGFAVSGSRPRTLEEFVKLGAAAAARAGQCKKARQTTGSAMHGQSSIARTSTRWNNPGSEELAGPEVLAPMQAMVPTQELLPSQNLTPTQEVPPTQDAPPSQAFGPLQQLSQRKPLGRSRAPHRLWTEELPSPPGQSSHSDHAQGTGTHKGKAGPAGGSRVKTSTKTLEEVRMALANTPAAEGAAVAPAAAMVSAGRPEAAPRAYKRQRNHQQPERLAASATSSDGAGYKGLAVVPTQDRTASVASESAFPSEWSRSVHPRTSSRMTFTQLVQLGMQLKGDMIDDQAVEAIESASHEAKDSNAGTDEAVNAFEFACNEAKDADAGTVVGEEAVKVIEFANNEARDSDAGTVMAEEAVKAIEFASNEARDSDAGTVVAEEAVGAVQSTGMHARETDADVRVVDEAALALPAEAVESIDGPAVEKNAVVMEAPTPGICNSPVAAVSSATSRAAPVAHVDEAVSGNHEKSNPGDLVGLIDRRIAAAEDVVRKAEERKRKVVAVFKALQDLVQ